MDAWKARVENFAKGIKQHIFVRYVSGILVKINKALGFVHLKNFCCLPVEFFIEIFYFIKNSSDQGKFMRKWKRKISFFYFFLDLWKTKRRTAHCIAFKNSFGSIKYPFSVMVSTSSLSLVPRRACLVQYTILLSLRWSGEGRNPLSSRMNFLASASPRRVSLTTVIVPRMKVIDFFVSMR